MFVLVTLAALLLALPAAGKIRFPEKWVDRVLGPEPIDAHDDAMAALERIYER